MTQRILDEQIETTQKAIILKRLPHDKKYDHAFLFFYQQIEMQLLLRKLQ